jgi:hypothetical protein
LAPNFRGTNHHIEAKKSSEVQEDWESKTISPLKKENKELIWKTKATYVITSGTWAVAKGQLKLLTHLRSPKITGSNKTSNVDLWEASPA